MADIINPNYVDNGELREQDRLPLDRYLAKTDRATPNQLRGMPFFSGREAEVSTFRHMVNRIALGDAANATLAIEGPPGAGKSALLCQFMEDMRQLPPIGSPPRPWLPVFMDGGSAVQPESLMLAVDDAIAHRLASEFLQSTQGDDIESASTRLHAFLNTPKAENAKALAKGILDRGISGFGFTVGAKSEPTPTTLLKLANLRQHKWSDWQVVLMLDEAQHISLKPPGADPHLLSSLHQGATNLHMTFCAFGLPGTFSALADAGVSRLSQNHDINLQGLNSQNSAKVVNRCFTHYGLIRTGPLKQAILERSANWPQHLSAYLTATLSLMQSHAGRDENLGMPPDELLEQAIERGDRSRANYYSNRIKALTRHDPDFLQYARHIIPSLAQNNGHLPERQVLDALKQPPISLPQPEARAFLAACTQSGLLAPGISDTLHLAIPTFAAYIMGEEPPPLQESTHQVEP